MTETLSFAAPSAAVDGVVSLQTSSGYGPAGRLDHPHFFSGFVVHAEQAAKAILAVTKVAGTSYWSRVNWAELDPVVTSDSERLRFESFSGCGGVYARFDILPRGLDGDLREIGTTNIDANPELRLALATIRDGEPLRLQIGPDQLTATTLDAHVVERKVTLPPRWVRGFAEVSAVAAGMELRAEVDALAAHRFLASLPHGATRPLWVVPSGRTLRLTTAASGDAVCLSGVARLAELRPLLRFATRLRLYGPAPAGGLPTASVWELELTEARLTLAISPDVHRGFSGEGGVLRDLSHDDVTADADRVLDMLAWAPGADLEAIAFGLDLGLARVRRALTQLATSGLVGYDNAERTWFHRQLPYRAATAERANPRLRAARALVASGAIAEEDGVALVTSGKRRHSVQAGPDGLTCTCEWWGRYKGHRGPCSHVLAVELSRR